MSTTVSTSTTSTTSSTTFSNRLSRAKSLSTRLKELKISKKAKKPKYRRDWNGLEHIRNKMKELAREMVRKDAETHEICQKKGYSTIGSICQSIRDPSIVMEDCRSANECALLMRELMSLNGYLIQNENMCPMVVRSVTSTMLNPSEAEKEFTRISLQKAEQRDC